MSFTPGQVIRTYGLLARTHSGPFRHPTEGVWYVLETPEGHFIVRDEEEMSPEVE